MPLFWDTPTEADLSTLLAATGIDLPDGLDYTSALAGAIAAFERASGWQPFYSAQETTRTYDGPGATVLDLQGGLFSLTTLAISGTDYAAGGQYRLMPENAPLQGRPYTYIQFGAPGLLEGFGAGGYGFAGMDYSLPVFGYGAYGYLPPVPNLIAITGKWGYSLTLPYDVKQAVLQKAAADLAPILSLSISGGFFERKIGDSTKRYGGTADSGPLAMQITLWQKSFDATINRYRRLGLG